jgi:hypothetical protein|tara:strand:+ start:437 stop:637 length:201 start_codon:yes stop_codon:yes gene_type:complete
MQEITEYIEQELTSLKRGIVATPDEDYLDRFTDANNGCNDFLLMQMSKQYGYKLALLAIRKQLNTK